MNVRSICWEVSDPVSCIVTDASLAQAVPLSDSSTVMIFEAESTAPRLSVTSRVTPNSPVLENEWLARLPEEAATSPNVQTYWSIRPSGSFDGVASNSTISSGSTVVEEAVNRASGRSFSG